MAKKVGCHCAGNPHCKLCNGTKVYQYEPGPRGWMPFKCPNCEGTGSAEVPGKGLGKCTTCQGQGMVDPANPPSTGMMDVIWKSLFGAT
jgi:hypothetical protein